MIYNSDEINLKLLNDLNPRELQLYLYLYWKRDYRKNITYTSYIHIRKALKISDNNGVKKYLEGLREKGYIDIIPKKINGISTSYSYRLLVDIEYKGNIACKVEGLDNIKLNTMISEYTPNKDLQGAILDYIDMRTTVKPMNTEGEVRTLLRQLNTIASSDKDKITVLDNAIMGKWLNLYKLEQDKKKKVTYDYEGSLELGQSSVDRRI